MLDQNAFHTDNTQSLTDLGKQGKVCSALLSLGAKLICYILESQLAPSLVYHGALLSIALPLH